MPVLVYDCPRCASARMTHELVYARKLDQAGNVLHAMMACARCNDTSVVVLLPLPVGSLTPKDVPHIEDYFKPIDIRPKPETIEAPYGTPDRIARRFIEAEGGFRSGHWNSAVTMYRSCLDIATKQLAPNHAKLAMAKRIRAMSTDNQLPPAMADWADQVRLDGNEAVHGEDEFSEDEAAPLRHFTRMFLTYAYEMPQRVIDARATP